MVADQVVVQTQEMVVDLEVQMALPIRGQEEEDEDPRVVDGD